MMKICVLFTPLQDNLKLKKIHLLIQCKLLKVYLIALNFFLKKINVNFINDSKATSFTSSQLALSGLKNIYWILGGLPKK